MTLHYREQGQSIVVFGNTFPVKDRIKALGGRFNGAEKNWTIPLNDQNLAAMEDLCSTGGSNGGLQSFEGQKSSESSDLLSFESHPRQEQKRTVVNQEDSISVSQLMDRVSGTIRNAFSAPLWVVGEIQNLAIRGSGVFFELAERREGGHENSTTTVKTILWQSSRSYIEKMHPKESLKDLLADGMKIRCQVQVSLYRDRGNISLSVEDIDPSFTKGALALAREKLLKELRKKGLDRAQKQLTLPKFPFHVGLITAKGSRAHSDFEDQLLAGGFPGTLTMISCPMQGEAVTAKVVSALESMGKKSVDLIVITRGGGSAADLRWFDSEAVAYAVAGSHVPIVCAIGHHDDQSVAEEIAFMRQKTPTAAAEYVRSIFSNTREHIDALATTMAGHLDLRLREVMDLQNSLTERLYAGAERSLANRKEALVQATFRLSHGMTERITWGMRTLDKSLADLFRSADSGINSRELRAKELEGALSKRDPTPWLKAGWTQLWTPDGPVKSVTDLELDRPVTARLLDGRLKLKVDRIEGNESGK